MASPLQRRRPETIDLAAAWDANAPAFVSWAREPGHDSYWRFHRDQFLELVPPPGRLTLDIGCGEGRLSRDLTSLGHVVVGVDRSLVMLEHARAADPSIDVVEADAAALPFGDGFADLAIAFMSLQDVEDFRGPIREAARVLEPGGRFCLAIVHPLNSAGEFHDETGTSPLVIGSSYLDATYYVDTIERDGLTVELASTHRPLSAYTEALADAGFLIERLREPAVPEPAITEERQRRWQRFPLFAHIRALRTETRANAGRM